MNISKIKNTLLITTILSLLLSIVMLFVLKAENSLEIIYYPFNIIGDNLRKLSLSSTVGNLGAILIYVIISLIPAMIYFYKYKKNKHKNVDYILIGLSAYLLYAIYQFINPMELYSLLPEEFYGSREFITMGKLFIAMMFYIIIISYFVLLSLNSLSEEEHNKKKTLRSLQIILTLFLVSDIIFIFYFGFFNVLSERNSTQFFFYIIKYLLAVSPVIMSMVIIFMGIKLINDFGENQYGEEVIENMRKIYEYGKITVYLSVISSLLINGLQLFLASSIKNINMFLSIPFVPLIVAFVGIILCKYFEENKDLYDDNNTII